MRTTLVRLIFLMTLLTGCVHMAGLDEVPSEMRTRLALHPMWLTVASLDRPGVQFPPAELGAIKRWQVESRDGAAVVMQETAMSSFVGYLRRAVDDDEGAAEVSLTGGVTLRDFFPYSDWGEDIWERRKAVTRYRRLDDKRFVLELVGQTKSHPVLGRVVFLPVPNDYQAATDRQPEQPIGVWTTPFGPEGELYGHLRRRIAAAASPGDAEDQDKIVMDWEGRYLHHDLSVKRPIKVTFDETVPFAFRSSLAGAVDEWNKALGDTHLVLEQDAQNVDVADCLTGFRLCVSWRGPPEIEMGGASGYTELAFDPLTGLIVGGRIFVVNDSPAKLTDPTREMIRRLNTRELSDVADMVLSFNDYSGVRHQFSNYYLMYLFTHELGHFHGLGHDFHVGGKTNLDAPISTIMSYPVFPLAHRAWKVMPIDKRRLAVVYQGKGIEGLAPYCSTTDAFAPMIGTNKERRPEGCDMFVVGEPAEWYLTLAKRGRFGVFTQYPDNSQWSDEMRSFYQELLARGDVAPLNVLTHLGALLAEIGKEGETGRAKIRKYLCGLKNDQIAITAQLQDFHEVDLKCK